MKRQMVIFVGDVLVTANKVQALWKMRGKEFQSLRPYIWITSSIFEACALIRQNMGGVTSSNVYDSCLVIVGQDALENKNDKWYEHYEGMLSDVYTHNLFAPQTQQLRINFLWSDPSEGHSILPWEHLYPWWVDGFSLQRVDSRQWLCKLVETKPVEIKWLTQLNTDDDNYKEMMFDRYIKIIKEFIDKGKSSDVKS